MSGDRCEPQSRDDWKEAEKPQCDSKSHRDKDKTQKCNVFDGQ